MSMLMPLALKQRNDTPYSRRREAFRIRRCVQPGYALALPTEHAAPSGDAASKFARCACVNIQTLLWVPIRWAWFRSVLDKFIITFLSLKSCTYPMAHTQGLKLPWKGFIKELYISNGKYPVTQVIIHEQSFFSLTFHVYFLTILNETKYSYFFSHRN